MRSAGMLLMAGIVVLACRCEATPGATWYVDGRVPSSGDGTSCETAFQTIQEGIDAAGEKDTVIVEEATYMENIRFEGKNITLCGTDPLAPDVVANTIIDGNRSGAPAVTFSGREDGICVLSGFTIRNGSTLSGGGIRGNGTLAVIENNIIAGNFAREGAALHRCDGIIRNNTITGNSAVESGGLYKCSGVIQNNIITGNFARDGAGLFWCTGTVQNNIITGNSASTGGGLWNCDGTIRNNTITGNWAGNGAVLAYCDGIIQNNAITDNSAGLGAGLFQCNGTIQDNAITGNWASEGGGLYNCDAKIEGNSISDNSAGEDGGGLLDCQGTVESNTISSNSAGQYGGGLHGCSGTIQNNKISRNSARNGGGLHSCGGEIQGNVILHNWAEQEGGGLWNCQGTIRNSFIYGNSARNGGGISHCDGTILSNTIAGNSAESFGGGIIWCDGEIENCVICANTAAVGPQLYGSSAPRYCCIQEWAEGGEGNIAEDPRFGDAGNGNFRLLPSSPCIDAGFNHPDLPELDIRGMHRVMYGGKSLTVDMGAYEYYVNEIEVGEGGDVTLRWSSLAGKTYTVYFSADMMTWEVAAEGVPSLGDTVTTWLDPGAILSPAVVGRYYKIEEIE